MFPRADSINNFFSQDYRTRGNLRDIIITLERQAWKTFLLLTWMHKEGFKWAKMGLSFIIQFLLWLNKPISVSFKRTFPFSLGQTQWCSLAPKYPQISAALLCRAAKIFFGFHSPNSRLEIGPKSECIPSFRSLSLCFITSQEAGRLYCLPLKMASGGRLRHSGDVVKRWPRDLKLGRHSGYGPITRMAIENWDPQKFRQP